VERVAGAEQAALDALLEQRQDRAGQLDGGLGGSAGPSHDRAPLRIALNALVTTSEVTTPT